MKFKVGDRVRVRSDLQIDMKYGNDVFVRPMKFLLGTEQIVTNMFRGKYILSDCTYNFTDEMLEPVFEESSAVSITPLQTSKIIGSPEFEGVRFFTTNTEQKEDVVNRPAHYTQGKIEVIDFIEDKRFSYHLGNAIKYISRCEHKGNKEQDLKKAVWYLQRELENLKNGKT